jgi:putative flippase GtrA
MQVLILKNQIYNRVVMFLISAGATGTIYMGLLYLCRNVLAINPYLSVSVAYTAAMAFYFITNKLVVFRKRNGGSVWRELIKFLPLATVNYILTLIIVALIRKYTHEEYSGSVVAGLVTTALAYLVFDKWLFNKKG